MSVDGSSQQNSSSSLELSLYENAMDSIRHALEHYTSDSDEKRRYKYAILHLSQGVLLLLKERLKREHPNFIYTNITDESKTVDVDFAISRLEKIAKVDLGSYAEAIRELASVRNRVEHYAMSLSKQQVDSIIGRIIPFLSFFTEIELERQFSSEIGGDNWQALLSIQEYVAHAIKDAEARIKRENKKPHLCKKCQAYTATEIHTFPEDNNKWRLQGSEIKCLVCMNFVALFTKCRHCGLEVQVDSYTNLNHFSYCQTCMTKLGQQYEKFHSDSRYIEEVRKWFLENETISIGMLENLLWNVLTAGPTGRPQHIETLYYDGLIDFAYDYEKTRYLTMKEAMPAYARGITSSGATFKWVYLHDE